jgi:predicted transcriptional regulator
MENTSPGNQAQESAPRTLKDLVQRAAKTLSPETSVQEACDQLRSEKITSSPVTDQNLTELPVLTREKRMVGMAREQKR